MLTIETSTLLPQQVMIDIKIKIKINKKHTLL